MKHMIYVIYRPKQSEICKPNANSMDIGGL